MRKKFITIVLAVLFCFRFISSAGALPSDSYTLVTESPSLSAKSAVLIDAATNTVLCEKNARERMGMASTTKIMTALVAAEHGDLDKTVSVSPLAVGVEGSSIYLYAGEQLKLCDLISAMLLESANDAAAAIAIEIGGSIEGFCNMMNNKAAELGLGIELNGCDFNLPNEQVDNMLRPYRIAKACGCKFTFGSDAHGAAQFVPHQQRAQKMADALGLTEQDIFRV